MSDLESKIKKRLRKKGFSSLQVQIRDEDVVHLSGEVGSYEEFVRAGLAAGKYMRGVRGVVNNVSYPNQKEYTCPKASSEDLGEVDVVVIGGGVTGCSVARELAKYKLRVAVFERSSDVSCGATKANNAMVHSGIGERPGTLKQRLCVEGHFKFEKIARDLQVPYDKNGLYITLMADSLVGVGIPRFLSSFLSRFLVPHVIVQRGKKMGIPMELVKKKRLLSLEPSVSDDVLVAVSSPSYGVTSPYEYTIALAENAVENGVQFFLDAEVVSLGLKNQGVSVVKTTKGTIRTRFVVNAAGVYADRVAEMADDRFFTIHPRKGSILLFDKECCGLLNANVSVLKFPSPLNTKGGGIMPLPHGNVLWGPSAEEVEDPEDKSVGKKEIENVFEVFTPLMPGFPKNNIITFFAGVRAPSFTEDFIIQSSRKVKGLVHAAAIQSPGLAASPAVAGMVVGLLREQGLVLEEKKEFDPVRKAPVIVRKLSLEERKKVVEKNPRYGRVVCRCEEITEGEIVDAIHRPIPATSLDAVKRRTRAGMGRCQSGFCLPKVAEIIARETGVPLEEVLKNEKGSEVFVGPAKCLLLGGEQK